LGAVASHGRILCLFAHGPGYLHALRNLKPRSEILLIELLAEVDTAIGMAIDRLREDVTELEPAARILAELMDLGALRDEVVAERVIALHTLTLDAAR